MFEDWKRAWRQAVENFQREVHDGTPGAPPPIRAMERELVSAAGALSKLDDEIRRTRSTVESELREEQVCRRREVLARNVEDVETARIAAEFGDRHGERAAVLTRKLTALEEERSLLARDVETMRDMVTKAAAAVGAGDAAGAFGGYATGSGSAADGDRDFSRLERDARERAAAERLEELKRRMGG
jgi:D-ribose pyranose/furanose isomerase RbsD